MHRARFTMLAIAIVSLVLFAVTAAQAATGDKRVALVIGNSAYKHTVQLNNPVRDARAIAAALRELGFDVVEGLNLEMSGMRAKVREFTSKITGADVALFYYAGHGFQIDGQNHLAPVDARLKRESDVDFETVSLNLVLRQMEREKRTNLVFLDACRDNPLANQLARSMKSRSTAVGRGLAQVESGVGMMISYATSPGMVAFDGQGNHSPYTKALLEHIHTPGLSINDMMIAVRQRVLAESKGKQIPWEHSSLTGKYYFKVPVKIAAQSRPDTADGQGAVARAYHATTAVGSCGAYTLFAEQHRGTFYARLADEYLRTNCQPKSRQIQVEAADGISPRSTPETIVASAEPAPAVTPPAPAAADDATQLAPGALVVAIQGELDRVGCKPGKADGDWGARTRRAMVNFNLQAGLKLPVERPSLNALKALKAQPGIVCKTVVSTPPAKQRQAGRPAPSGPKKAPAKVKKKAVKTDRYWGGEDTRVQCEFRGAWTSDCFPDKKKN